MPPLFFAVPVALRHSASIGSLRPRELDAWRSAQAAVHDRHVMRRPSSARTGSSARLDQQQRRVQLRREFVGAAGKLVWGSARFAHSTATAGPAPRVSASADQDAVLIEEIGRDTLVFSIDKRENIYLVRSAMMALIGVPTRKSVHLFEQKLKDYQARLEESLAGEARLQFLVVTEVDDDRLASLDYLSSSLPPLCLVATPSAQQKILAAIPRLIESVWQIVRSEADILSFGGAHILQTLPGRRAWADSLFLCDTHSGIWFTGRLFAEPERGPSAVAARKDLQLSAAARRAWFEGLPEVTEEDLIELESVLDEPAYLAPACGPVVADPNLVLSEYIKWTSP